MLQVCVGQWVDPRPYVGCRNQEKNMQDLRNEMEKKTIMCEIEKPGSTRANSLGLADHNHHTSSLGPVALFSPFFKCVRYIRVD